MLHMSHDSELETDLNRARITLGLDRYDSPPTRYETWAIVILMLIVGVLTLLAT
jgi:hypothetical protein